MAEWSKALQYRESINEKSQRSQVRSPAGANLKKSTALLRTAIANYTHLLILLAGLYLEHKDLFTISKPLLSSKDLIALFK